MKVTNGPVNDGSVDWIKNTTVKCTFLLFKEKINVDFYSFEVAKDWSSEGYKVNLYINLSLKCNNMANRCYHDNNVY